MLIVILAWRFHEHLHPEDSRHSLELVGFLELIISLVQLKWGYGRAMWGLGVSGSRNVGTPGVWVLVQVASKGDETLEGPM